MRRTRGQSRRPLRSGFTMIEMLVVAILGVFVVGFIANVSRWYCRTLHAIHVDAQLDRELRIASDAIGQDFGTASNARTSDGMNLQLNNDDNNDGVAQWGSGDSVIEYKVQGGILLRNDLATGVSIPIANNMSSLAASVVSGNLNIHLTASHRNTDEDITLSLQNP